mgnify:CR=1 FL=1
MGAGDLVEVDGRAGALRLPSGKVLRVAMHGQDQLRTKATFIRLTQAGLRESHVHDVIITKEAPNYRLES